MRKVIVSVQECVPGMQMAETIFNDYGAVVISENTILDAHMIRKFDNLGITRIKVFEHDENIISANHSEIFKAQYNENVAVVKDILRDISQGKNINIDKVNDVADSVYFRINDNRDIVGCINQIRNVDEYTYTHCINVSLLSMLIGKWLKIGDQEKMRQLIQAGLLHDIGKSRVPLEILNKPSMLTNEEYAEMKKHTVYGYRIVENLPEVSKDVCMGVLMHHEREDGTGYPIGLKGSQIHEFAKIIAVADIYDAMTSNRVYREKEPPFEVFELMENRTFGFLDPVVVNAFLANIAAYYIGDFVRLNTGEIGEVLYINQRCISRPLIRVEDRYIDLSLDSGIKILELI